MLRTALIAPLFVTGLGWSLPVASQAIEDWTQRPDARAPAGVSEDALLAPGSFEMRYNLQVTSFEGLKVGQQEIPAVLVLRDWDLAPLSMTTQRHEVEIRAGFEDWFGASIKVPFYHTTTELANEVLSGTPSSTGFGDIEVHALLGLHETWPHRGHLIAGISVPTGSVEKAGPLPTGTFGEPDGTLPYPMQPGDGTVALIPGAVFVTENEFGTVGLLVRGRIPVGENDRGWRRGNSLNGQIWLAYRFTDWVSGSTRVSYLKTGDLEGFDPGIDAFSSPLAHPDLQSGTRVEIPLGINLQFPEGRLEGNRIHLEVILPVHQDVDGPQLIPNSGVALSWGIAF